MKRRRNEWRCFHDSRYEAAEKLPADYQPKKREKYEVDTKSHLIYDRHENGVMFQINTLGPRPAMGRKGRKYD